MSVVRLSAARRCYGGTGATAGHGARAAPGRAPAARRDRHAGPASTATSRCSRPRPSSACSSATSTTGAAATVLTAHVPNPTGYGRIVRDGRRRSLGHRRGAGRDARRSGQSPRSTAAFTPSTSRPLFPALHRITPAERPGRVLPDRPRRPSTAGDGRRSKRSASRAPTRCAASTAARSWPRCTPSCATSSNRGADGGWRHAARSGQRPTSVPMSRSAPDTVIHPSVYPRGADPHRRRAARFRPASASSTRRSATT